MSVRTDKSFTYHNFVRQNTNNKIERKEDTATVDMYPHALNLDHVRHCRGASREGLRCKRGVVANVIAQRLGRRPWRLLSRRLPPLRITCRRAQQLPQGMRFMN